MDRIISRVNDINNNASDVVVTSSSLENYGLTDITLRSYQEKGVEWLCQRFHGGHGCILGDEMGLGKTCQTISFLLYLRGSGESSGPHMILSPLSVLPNWQGELARFAPKMKVICYVGDKDTREKLRSKIKKNIDDISVIVTTYELCLKDEVFLRRYRWHTLIVDEAHRLKNRESLLHRVLKEFDISHHVLLTGTPVQNNLAELYALLSFVAPNIFKGKYLEKFVEKYNDVETGSDEAKELHNLLQPFLLRRVKNEVVLDLPQRSEVVLYHGMSALQKKYYKAILTKDLDVFNNANPSKKTRLLNILMQLRKCVNHPYLFDGVEPEPFQIGEHIVEASGKLVLIDQLLGYLQPRGHKVLLFSQMTHMLDILQDYLTFRGYSYERLDGSVRGEERYIAVQSFNEDDDTFIFLLSTRAGGVGLNLVAADTVIFVDSDFNPQNDLQAAARAHRIGQTRPVKVLRLVGRSTVEQVIIRRAEAKLKLTNTVIEGGQFSLGAADKEGAAAMDNGNELQDILKFGVDKLFADEDSTIEDVDFDTILGPTVDGEWQPEEENKEAQATLMTASMDVDDMEEGGTLYTFEGTDYAQEPSTADKKAFDDLISAQKAVLEEEETQPPGLRRTKTARVLQMLPEPPKRERKKLTPEQIEERKKKRAENLARKAEEAKAEEARRAAVQKRRLEKLWEENGYESCNLPLPDDSEDEDEDEEVAMATDDEDGSGDSRAIRYVVGDVTHPAYADGKDAIVVHCVDDSGRWGYGGLFSALARRSAVPEDAYTLAGKMKDLHLGDCHLVPVDDLQSREKGKDYVCLIIAQHRDRKNNLSGIKLEALSEGLQRLYKAAIKHKASVHLPRIGHKTPGFNWYGTERLIRKHLASRGVPTFIYYFPRKKVAKRKRSASSSDDEVKKKPTPAKKPTVRFSPSTSPDHKSRSPSPSNHVSAHSPSPDKKHRSDSPIPSTSAHDISDSDTNNTPVKRPPPLDESETPVKKSMEDEESDAEPSESFLENITIYLHNLPPDVKKKFTRSIISHDGDVHQTIEESTDYAVVDADISDEDLKTLKSATADFLEDVTIVTTQWLDDSCQARRKRAIKNYTVG